TWWVGPINRGQISPCSPSEQFLAQREGLDSRPKLDGWSEKSSGTVLADGTFLQVHRIATK
ncbi:hypothetical protein A2U01_0048202, partial [Trifolium medium]|nr:hypothetical protein [Trifolium medium]